MTPAKRLAFTLLGVLFAGILFSALTSAGIIQLKNDNGDFYQGSFAGRIAGDIDGAVLTPAPDFFPLTIRSVEFAFHRPRSADHIADSAQVRVQIYAMVDGVPGDILAESEPQTLAGFDVWHSIALDPPLVLDEPASFLAAVKWESGTDEDPAPSVATDSNLSAPQAAKDQANLFHDADLIFGSPPCQTGFCTHSEFWGDPAFVGFNMIRVTVDAPEAPTETPQAPTETPDKPVPTATVVITPPPVSGRSHVYLPGVLHNYVAFLNVLKIGAVPGEAVSYALTSGDSLADRCWPGVETNLWVGSEPADGRGIMRSVIRFDLSTLPTGLALTEANLRLVAVEAPADDTPITVSVHDITRAWTGCPTWNSLADAAGKPWGNVTVGPTVEVYTIDVTSLVERWLRGELPNYGLMLRGDETGEGRFRGFVPTASSQEDLRPTLMIRYRKR